MYRDIAESLAALGRVAAAALRAWQTANSARQLA
jgi:hypothetical protein